ncbi:MAG: hypothetical protein WCS89_03425 [Candidatus Paceibacterota bacterium]
MLYIFHGTNISKSSDKARSLVNSLRAKKPDATYVEINSDNWNPSIIEEHLGGQGLFSSKYIIFLNRLAEKEDVREKLIEMLSVMKESDNIFIINEGKILAELKKAFDKNGDKVVVSDEVKSSVTKDFNIFSLADAIGAKDRFKAWSIYRQAIEKGLESESILGTIFWQIKSMVLAFDAKSASEAGLNPFVYSKAKKFSSNYSKQELSDLLLKSITLYHEGHRGRVDLELGTEKLLLKL